MPRSTDPVAAAPVAALVLIDEDLAGDRRVQQTLQECGPQAGVLDIRASGATAGTCFGARLDALPLALALLLGGLGFLGRVRELLGDRLGLAFFSGLGACLDSLAMARRASVELRSRLAAEPAGQLVANDLTCALAALLTPLPAATLLIYDSHELQVHRNRRTGWLRVLIEVGAEARILRRADELRVPSRSIAEALNRLHRLPELVRVVYNDFYPWRPIPEPPAHERPVLVYVGTGLRGRMLELLDRPASELGCDVHVYLLGAELPPSLSGRHWRQGPVDYEADLLALARTRRCLMWCCLEHASLSYTLALPNKFFQALAAGLPIVTAPGTYLADIVLRHGIGVVLEPGGFVGLVRIAQSGDYAQMASQVATLRNRLRSGELEL